MIPERACARFNIRFNIEHNSAELIQWIEGVIDNARTKFDASIELNVRVSGESFLTPPCKLTDIIQNSAEKILGIKPDPVYVRRNFGCSLYNSLCTSCRVWSCWRNNAPS